MAEGQESWEEMGVPKHLRERGEALRERVREQWSTRPLEDIAAQCLEVIETHNRHKEKLEAERARLTTEAERSALDDVINTEMLMLDATLQGLGLARNEREAHKLRMEGYSVDIDNEKQSVKMFIAGLAPSQQKQFQDLDAEQARLDKVLDEQQDRLNAEAEQTTKAGNGTEAERWRSVEAKKLVERWMQESDVIDERRSRLLKSHGMRTEAPVKEESEVAKVERMISRSESSFRGVSYATHESVQDSRHAGATPSEELLRRSRNFDAIAGIDRGRGKVVLLSAVASVVIAGTIAWLFGVLRLN